MSTPSSSNLIFHVDMDYFFAQCEEVVDESIKHKPVVIGADPKHGAGRGVVSTCNYIAREYGIRSAMPISEAYNRCPHALFLPPNFKLYKEKSREIMKKLIDISQEFEQVSIDEAYLIPKQHIKSYEHAKEVALFLQTDIINNCSTSCSIGIGPNKMIAKIASDLKKPRGITAVSPSDFETLLFPLSVRKIPGVGKQMQEKLEGRGIITIKDLTTVKESMLHDWFGVYGIQLKQLAMGNDNRGFHRATKDESISKETTFDEDTSDPIVLIDEMNQLSTIVHKKIYTEKKSYKTVSIRVRFSDFTTLTRSKSFESYHTDLVTIKETASELLKEFLTDEPLRLIGVKVSSISDIKQQKQLFDF